MGGVSICFLSLLWGNSKAVGVYIPFCHKRNRSPTGVEDLYSLAVENCMSKLAASVKGSVEAERGLFRIHIDVSPRCAIVPKSKF